MRNLLTFNIRRLHDAERSDSLLASVIPADPYTATYDLYLSTIPLMQSSVSDLSAALDNRDIVLLFFETRKPELRTLLLKLRLFDIDPEG